MIENHGLFRHSVGIGEPLETRPNDVVERPLLRILLPLARTAVYRGPLDAPRLV